MSLQWVTRCSAIIVWAAAITAPAGTGDWQFAGRDRVVVAEFSRRVSDYVALHRRLEGPVPTIQVSSDPDEVRRATVALAGKIRAARGRARQGDFFTPDVARVFRASIATACGGDFDLVYETAIEENPELRSWRPRVNGAYPESAPYSMVSPNVLCNLPELPEELQYRFWGRDLLLWDYHANVIVDVLPDAIPST
jgi:hypothetical protein